jgi:hypothetical protein
MKTHYFVFKAADNYCPANASKTVTVAVTVRSQALDITASGPATICAGDTVILTASGALSYTWNTGETTNSIPVTLILLFHLQLTQEFYPFLLQFPRIHYACLILRCH